MTSTGTTTTNPAQRFFEARGIRITLTPDPLASVESWRDQLEGPVGPAASFTATLRVWGWQLVYESGTGQTLATYTPREGSPPVLRVLSALDAGTEHLARVEAELVATGHPFYPTRIRTVPVAGGPSVWVPQREVVAGVECFVAGELPLTEVA